MIAGESGITNFGRGHIRLSSVLTTFLLLGSISPAWGTTYFVAGERADASDQGPGTTAAPFRTITHAVSGAKAGDVIEVQAGTYRGERIVFRSSGTKAAPVILRAAKGSMVEIKGSVTANSGWQMSNGRIFKRPLNNLTPYFSSAAHLTKGQGLSRNQVFVDGAYIRQVTLTENPEPGTFSIDDSHTMIYLWLPDGGDPNSGAHNIEVTNTEGPLLTTSGHSFINIEGLHFEHGANQPQGAALLQIARGEGSRVDHCSVQFAAGAGISITDGSGEVITDSTFNHNGQQGIVAGRITNAQFSGNETSYNNIFPDKVFDRFWEAGGNKFSMTRSSVVARHIAHDNFGPGIWFDIDNENALITQSASYRNTIGIVYEISWNGTITNNLAYQNNLGIYLFSSAGCKLYNNTTVDNREAGIAIRGAERDDGAGHSILPYSNDVRDNIISTAEAEGPSAHGIELALSPMPALKGRSLISLVPNKSDHNLFYGATSKAFFGDGPRDHSANLAEWQKDTQLDLHSKWGDPKFIHGLENGKVPDFRTQPDSPARKAGVRMPEAPNDFRDVPRQTESCDIGAYEES